MSFEIPRTSYICSGSKVHNWNSVPPEQTVVVVGKYTSIADNLTCYADGNHRFDFASTYPFRELGRSHESPITCWGKGAPTIGNDVWIGNNVTIMSGVRVGDGSVVAANSVVTKDVAPYSVVAGNPAVRVKYRFPDDLIRDMVASEWWLLPDDVVLRELAPVQADPRRWVQLANEAKGRLQK